MQRAGLVAAVTVFACMTAHGLEVRLRTEAHADTLTGPPPYRLSVTVQRAASDPDPGPALLTIRDLFREQTVVSRRIPLSVRPGETAVVPVLLPDLPPGAYQARLEAGGQRAGLRFACLAGPDPAGDSTFPPFFGVNGHRFTRADFDLYRRYGFQVKRDVFDWRQVHIAPGVFDWSIPDARTTDLLQAGVQPMPILCYTPRWAAREPHAPHSERTPPLDIRDYEQYVRAAARRYHDRIRIWEVWNEENTGFFTGSAEDYALLQKTACITLRVTAPDALVVSGGTAGVDLYFLQRLADAGALDYCDVLAVHTYAWGPPEKMVRPIRELLAWRDRVAPGLPVWSSEWGVKCAEEGGPSPRVQAEYVARQTILHKATGLAHSSLYLWLWSPFKVMNYNLSPKPAAIAHRTCVQVLSDTVPVGFLLENDDHRWACLFEHKGSGQLILAAWSTGPERRLEGVPVVGKARRVDLMGASVPVRGRTVDLTLRTAPVFVCGVAPSLRTRVRRKTSAGPTRRRPVIAADAWMHVGYPQGNTCFPCLRGGTVRVPVTVYHRGPEAATVRLRVTTPDGLSVTPREIALPVAGNVSLTCDLMVSAETDAPIGCRTVVVEGVAGDAPCGRIAVRVYVADGFVTEFRCNEAEEHFHRTGAKHAGAAEGVVWTSGRDGFIEWTFDLRGCRGAALTMDCGAHLEKRFAVRASGDGKRWTPLYEGPGQDRERTWDLTGFAGKLVRVRILDLAGGPPSGARVRSIRLLRVPAAPAR